MEGTGADAGPAAEVVAAIAAAGGSAVADASDIASADGAQAVVDAALSQFGRLDIVINNAGIIRWAGFPEADEDNLTRHLAVHTVGSFLMARAAWPHLCAQGYGRIVMTTSSGVFGLPTNISYATAKAAVSSAWPAQPGHGRGRARDPGQPHRAGGGDPHGRSGRRRGGDVAGGGGAHGGLPGP